MKNTLLAARSLLFAFYFSCLTLTLLENRLHAAVLVSADSISSFGSGTGRRTASSGEVTSERNGAFDDGSDRVRVRAKFGVLSAYAECRFVNKGSSGMSVWATGTASFTEDFMIDAPDLAGQTGFLKFKVDIHGSLAAALRGAGTESIWVTRSYAQTRFTVSTEFEGARDDLEKMYGDGTTTISGLPFLNRLETIVVPFSYGTTFHLTVSLQAAANARGEFGADCISDVGHTLEWGGIVSVTDSGGNTVTNHTITTGSGMDYSAPILDAPRFTLTTLSPGQLQLSWSTNYPAFTLESAAALSASWQTVTNSTGISGEQHTLTIDAVTTSQFFRLRKN